MKRLLPLILLALAAVAAAQTRATGADGHIKIIAAMINEAGNPTRNVRANDIVRFRVVADSDCYIAILCIAADGERTYLDMKSNFMEAGVPRYFPDIAGARLRVADDGVAGAEYIVIYACSAETGLPSRKSGGKGASGDFHTIMRRQRASKAGAAYRTGIFRINYTVLER